MLTCCNGFFGPLVKYIKSYMEFRENQGYKNKSYISALRSLNSFLKEKQIKSVKEINRAVILDWFGEQKHHKPQGKRQRLSQINLLFRYLQRIDVLKNNPTEGIIIKGSKHQPYIYSIKEIGDILNEAKKLTKNPDTAYQGELYYALIYLIYAMGLRLSEALNIRIKDIDFKNKTIFIYRGKFSKERLLPFSENTFLKLKRFLKLRLKIYLPENDEEPVFCNRHHKSYSKEAIEYRFRKFTRDCGLIKPGENPPRIHDIRHTFATHLLHKWYSEGKDVLNMLPILSRYMGHVDISSTQLYITISNTLLHQVNKLFENKFKKYFL